MHLNEDGLNMLIAACDGVDAAALGDPPAIAGLADGAVRLSACKATRNLPILGSYSSCLTECCL